MGLGLWGRQGLWGWGLGGWGYGAGTMGWDIWNEAYVQKCKLHLSSGDSSFVIGGLKLSDNLRILLGTAHPVFSKGLRIDSSERPVEAILPL